MNIDAFSLTIGFSIGGVLGYLLKTLIENKMARDRDTQNRNITIFNNAAKEFSDIIHIELKDIYPIPVNWPHNIDMYFRERFPILQSAIDKFSGHLSKREKENFDMAWHLYRLGKEGRDIDQQYYGQYQSGKSTTAFYGKEITEIIDGKKNLKHNVDKLLSFAKQK